MPDHPSPTKPVPEPRPCLDRPRVPTRLLSAFALGKHPATRAASSPDCQLPANQTCFCPRPRLWPLRLWCLPACSPPGSLEPRTFPPKRGSWGIPAYFSNKDHSYSKNSASAAFGSTPRALTSNVSLYVFQVHDLGVSPHGVSDILTPPLLRSTRNYAPSDFFFFFSELETHQPNHQDRRPPVRSLVLRLTTTKTVLLGHSHLPPLKPQRKGRNKLTNICPLVPSSDWLRPACPQGGCHSSPLLEAEPGTRRSSLTTGPSQTSPSCPSYLRFRRSAAVDTVDHAILLERLLPASAGMCHWEAASPECSLAVSQFRVSAL